MRLRILSCAVAVLGLVSCATKTPEQKQQEQLEEQQAKQQEEIKRQEQPIVEIPPGTRLAEAVLVSKNGSQVTGTVTFEQLPNNMLVTFQIQGLPPKKEFGFHVHEVGDCSSDDAKSAGGHYMPISDRGGTSADNPGRYAGDFPMLRSDKDGMAEGNHRTSKLSVAGKRAVIGRAIMVHGGPDNIHQPSATRIACGEIKVKQPVSVPLEEAETETH